jgi:hypothetical protein
MNKLELFWYDCVSKVKEFAVVTMWLATFVILIIAIDKPMNWYYFLFLFACLLFGVIRYGGKIVFFFFLSACFFVFSDNIIQVMQAFNLNYIVVDFVEFLVFIGIVKVVLIPSIVYFLLSLLIRDYLNFQSLARREE